MFSEYYGNLLNGFSMAQKTNFSTLSGPSCISSSQLKFHPNAEYIEGFPYLSFVFLMTENISNFIIPARARQPWKGLSAPFQGCPYHQLSVGFSANLVMQRHSLRRKLRSLALILLFSFPFFFLSIKFFLLSLLGIAQFHLVLS